MYRGWVPPKQKCLWRAPDFLPLVGIDISSSCLWRRNAAEAPLCSRDLLNSRTFCGVVLSYSFVYFCRLCVFMCLVDVILFKRYLFWIGGRGVLSSRTKAVFQTALGFSAKTGLRLLVRMLWTVWFWRGCLGNESNDITVSAKCVSKNVYALHVVMCLIMF